MTVKELKNNKSYSCYCNIKKDYVVYTEYFDEWGCAYVSIGNGANEIGVEYNLCIDGGKNCSAIYKVFYNENTDYMETDYDKFIHYEIDFDNPKWMEKLENAMCEALIELFNLKM